MARTHLRHPDRPGEPIGACNVPTSIAPVRCILATRDPCRICAKLATSLGVHPETERVVRVPGVEPVDLWTPADLDAVTLADGFRETVAALLDAGLVVRLQPAQRFELSDAARRELDRPARPRERSTSRPWARTPDHAVRAYVEARDAGASLRSTSDPDRANRVQRSRSPGLGGREHAAIERTATVARALDDAERRYPMALSRACPVLEPAQCRAVYVLLVCGLPVTRMVRKQAYEVRVQLAELDALDRVRDRFGVDVRIGHLHGIRAHFDAVVGEWLRASGEMRGRRRAGPRGPRPSSFRAQMRAAAGVE